jgi:DNA-binding transcriptional regulator/RsmH inhibitor MraZ
MKNNFINNNGANLLNTKNKKTKIENRIAELKQQEQAITQELESWEIKDKKVYELLTYLAEIEKFGTTFLAEAVKVEKDQENRDDYRLEQLIKDKAEFAIQFAIGREVFYQLVWNKIVFQVNQLKKQLGTIQSQLSHQERIFSRIEIRRQGRILLDCKLNNRLGCPGVYQCDNCQTNYSVNNQQFQEVASP